MISDGVSCRRNAPHQFRLRGGAATQQKEGCPHVVLSKYVEQSRSPCRIRAIVKGERQLAGPRGCRKRRTEDARTRPQRRVGVRAHGAAWAEYDARGGYVQNRQLGVSVGAQENEDAFARLRLRPWGGAELALELSGHPGPRRGPAARALGGPLYSGRRAQEGVTDL